MKRRIIIFPAIFLAGFIIYTLAKKINLNFNCKVGQQLDSLNGVVVYYNGGVANSSGRNTSSDNYNLGIKYQCVEFVKRYYYEHLSHKMPDSYGNAKDFFDKDLGDGECNKKRGLMQYKNGGRSKPCPDDLIIFSGSAFNKYGHVAIVSFVTDQSVEIIQQNPGPFGKSREIFGLKFADNTWSIDDNKILGWLRKE